MYNIETIQTMRSAAINILINRETYEDAATKINVKAANLKYFIKTMMNGIRIRGKIIKVTDVVRILGPSTNPVCNPLFATMLIRCINQYERPKQKRKPNNKPREENRNKTEIQKSISDGTKHANINEENDGYHGRLVGKKEKRHEKNKREKGLKGNLNNRNQNRWDEINKKKAVIIENIDDVTLMPNLVKKEELCFLLLENDILKNKLRFQSTPLQHKFINLLDDLYEDKSNLTKIQMI